MEDDIVKLLKGAYDSGREDGFILGAHGIECNDFDDVLIENYLEIKRIVPEIHKNNHSNHEVITKHSYYRWFDKVGYIGWAAIGLVFGFILSFIL